MLLFFPNLYRVGMANLGFQTIYRIANSVPGVSCDRCFLPDPSLTPFLDKGEELVSMELKLAPREFHILAFSVSFEPDLFNVIRLLRWSKVEPIASHRRPSDPLVIIGGIVPSANPEPFAVLADIILVGEGEELLPQVLEAIKGEGTGKTTKLFHRLSSIPGVYIPSLYRPHYDHFGRFMGVTPVGDVPMPIRWRSWGRFCQEGNQAPLITQHSVFPGTLLVEVSRGCPHLCRFCLSAHLYRPVRMVEKGRLLKSIDRPCQKLGLMGTSISHYPHLVQIVDKAVSVGKEVSFSSLRVDAPLPVLRLVSQQGKRATFGIEAATERLRRVAGKPIPQDTIMERLLYCVAHGARTLKLYFMIGLPTEMEEDIEALVSFPKELLHHCRKESLPLPQVHISLSPFVPKPHTPFQWFPMDTRETLRAKIRKVESGLRGIKRVVVTGEGPKWSLLQGLISKGDRKVGEALALSVANDKDWLNAIKGFNLSLEYYLHRMRDMDEPFPWEIVDTGWGKEELRQRGWFSNT